MFDECYSPLVAYARRRTDHATADDVVAETLLVAWRRFDDLPAAPLPWLYGVARRVLANERRRLERRARLHARLGVAVLPSVDSGAANSASDATLVALQRLSPDDQEILRLSA